MQVGIKAIPYNYALRTARKRAGLTQKQLAEQMGMLQTTYSNLERMRRRVTELEAVELSLILDEDEHGLFPPPTREVRMARVGSIDFVVEVESLDELPSGDLGLMVEGPEKMWDRAELSRTLSGLLADLRPREQAVLDARYGLSTGEAQSLEQVACQQGISRSRVSQIEHIALRKMRHPIRSRELRQYT